MKKGVLLNDTTAGAAHIREAASRSKPLLVRGVRLDKINFPVRVEHAQLDMNERLDARHSRIDILELSIEAHYGYQNLTHQSFDGLWNYRPLYDLVCESDVPTLTGPLEGQLDLALQVIQESMKSQGVDFAHAEVRAVRKGLSVGSPVLKRIAGSQPSFEFPCFDVRSAGIQDFALSLAVDHSWCAELDRIEHKDIRNETGLVTFDVYTRGEPLCASSLKGLINYVSTVELLDKYQGRVINEPAEYVVELVRSAVEREARKQNLELLGVDIELTRTGYARATPTLTLKARY
ncbi:hypothetical protein CL689_02630 [Candidatus Saccharibacteria bacterium]|nr:hypothetical protein [Candidatus Saccharibacteria bacterium]